MTEEIFVSVDMEADGPIPGKFSMLSHGSAAFTPQGKLISTFTENLLPLPEAIQDPETMAWWATQKEAWKNCQQNQQEPEVSIKRYIDWLNKLPGIPVFVAWPANYDFMFMHWYLINFAGTSPFSYHALDMKTLAMATFGTTFKNATMSYEQFPDIKKLPEHIALNDAIMQGHMFFKIIELLKTKTAID